MLNHTSGSRAGIVAVYQRHQYFEEKREALEKWAGHVEKIIDAAKRTLPHPVGVSLGVSALSAGVTSSGSA